MASELTVGGIVPPVTVAGTAGRGLVISNATASYTNSIAVLDAPHSYGEISLKTVGAERLNIDSAGTSTFGGPVTITNAALNLSSGHSVSWGNGLIYSGTGTSDLNIATGGAARLTINGASGLATFSAGIAFSGQTDAAGMTATTLNHYEEGTWTPAYSAGAIAGTTITYAGRYTRIGRSVNLYCKISAAANDLVIGNYVALSGLPFAAAVTASGYSTTEDIDLDNGGEVNVGATSIYFGQTGSATATQTITATLTYQV